MLIVLLLLIGLPLAVVLGMGMALLGMVYGALAMKAALDAAIHFWDASARFRRWVMDASIVTAIAAAVVVVVMCDAVVRFGHWIRNTGPIRLTRIVIAFLMRPLVAVDRWLRGGTVRHWMVWPYRFATPPALVFTFLVTWALGYVYLWPGDHPDINCILKYDPLQIGHLTDAKGDVYFRSFNNEARIVVPNDQIPDRVRNAFVAAEDGGYWDNDGWDPGRTLVATFKAVFSKVFRYRPQGASGISQQLTRRVEPVTADLARRESGTELISGALGYIPTRIVARIKGPVFANRTVRKWREIKRSVNLETALEEHFKKADAPDPKRAAKEAILGTYLNEAYFGHGVYGIGYAAQFFFQKDYRTLTDTEAAYLASLLPSPVRYAKLDGDTTAAVRRRDEVLRRMAKEDFIKNDQMKLAMAEPLGLKIQFAPVKTEAASAVNMALFNELPGIGQTRTGLLQGRIQIQTTLRIDIQRIVNTAVKHGLYGNGKKDSGWTGRYPGVEVPQASVVVLGQKGEVLAMYGGEVRDPKLRYNAHMQLNRVFSERSPGSTIKIVDNASAMALGFTPDTEISDADMAWCMRKDNNGNCIEWKHISNYEPKKFGVLPLWEWSARSINTPYARLMRDMVGNTKEARAEADALEDILDKEAGHNIGNIDPGAAWMLKWAKHMGISTPLKPYISTVLGASEVTVMDMANVIHSAGTGQRAVPYLVSRITDNTGKDLYRNDGTLTPIPLTAPQLTHLQALLYNNVRNPEGTGHSLDTAEFGIEIAGKTGTSDDWRNAWYCGYNPDKLYVCVQVGFDDNRPMPGKDLPIYRAASGGWVALPIFREIMKECLGPGKPMGLPNSMPEPVKEEVNAYLARRPQAAAK